MPRSSGTCCTSSWASCSPLALVALVVYLMWEPGQNALRRIGLDFTRFGGDLGRGILLAAVIGIPGLGLYAGVAAAGAQRRGGRLSAGCRVVDRAAPAARGVRAGLTEEVIFIAYLFDRLRRLGWSWWAIILSTAALRGRLPRVPGRRCDRRQLRDGRRVRLVLPALGPGDAAVIAHTLLDIVAFVGLSPGRGAVARSLRPRAFAHRHPTPTPTPTP